MIKNKNSKNSFPGFLKWLGFLVVLLCILIFFGIKYESFKESSDEKLYPPPGKLVNIGGYRLHLNCIGKGSPTVVVETGWGDTSASWSWVQPEVAKYTRICTYDRAGMGWSESSPEPRTAKEFAKELHILLSKANETGPFVLVGHSLGGYTVRVYAHDYPKEVAGVVFVDPQNLSVSGKSSTSPAPKPATNSFIMLIARTGLFRLLAVPLGSVQDLPPKYKQAYTAYAVIPRSVQTFIDEGKGMSEGAAQARSVTTLGSLPIIVLTRGKDLDAESIASQARFLKLSTISKQYYADKSGHRIMIEQPEAAIKAILNMVEMIHANKLK